MRFTVNGLRRFFIVFGLLDICLNGKDLLSSAAVVDAISNGSMFLLGLGLLYVGAVLPKLLIQSTNRIYLVIALNALLSLARGIQFYLTKPSTFAVVALAITPIVAWWLYVNVKRLAAEARAQATDAQASAAAKVFE